MRAEVLTLAAQRHGNPSLALEVATDLLDTANLEPEAASLAHWVRGLALHELDRADRNEGSRGILLKTLDALGIGFDS